MINFPLWKLTLNKENVPDKLLYHWIYAEPAENRLKSYFDGNQ